MEIDLRQIRGFSTWAKKAPKATRVSTALMLNSMAFDLREEIPKTLARSFVIRSPKFVAKSIQVNKTQTRTPINQQVAQVGSVKNEASAKHGRFTGWAEQETGQRDRRTRTILPLARVRGNFRKKVRPSVKARRGRKFVTPSSFGMSGNKHTGSQILGAAKRLKITGILRMGNVAYKSRSGKFEAVQSLKRRPKQPKRVKWMKSSIDRYSRWVKPTIIWHRHFAKQMGVPKKR